VIAALHQPNHAPWLPFFSKMRAADVFIILDDFPFSSGGFIHRQRIPGPNGPRWLTVPLVKAPMNTRIDWQRIAPGWTESYIAKLESAYARSPYWDRYAWSLRSIAPASDNLSELNVRLIEWLRCFLLVKTPMAYSSCIDAPGKGSERVLALCQAVKATTYLSGPHGRDYLDLAAFDAAGIAVEFADNTIPDYPGKPDDFAPSALDLVMNCGPTAHEYIQR